MALQIVGHEVRDGTQVVDHGANHTDGVRAAQDRAKGPGSTAALSLTAHLVAALDFGDAARYVTNVDVKAARAADIAAESDPAVVGELLELDDDDVAKAHREEVLAKQPGYEFSLHGQPFSDAAWVVLRSDRHVEAHEPASFQELFTPVAGTRSATKKSTAPPKPNPKSAAKLDGKEG